MVACDISLDTPSDFIRANYFYSPVQFGYKGGKYYIGSLYVDAYVEDR
jgi:hypothetical protein